MIPLTFLLFASPCIQLEPPLPLCSTDLAVSQPLHQGQHCMAGQFLRDAGNIERVRVSPTPYPFFSDCKIQTERGGGRGGWGVYLLMSA